MIFNLPFQSSNLDFGITTDQDVSAIKAVWGDRAPMGENSLFVVRAFLPDGVEATETTKYRIQCRVNSALIRAGVSEKKINSVGVVFEKRDVPGLAVEPQEILDGEGKPFILPRKEMPCAA